MCKRIFFSQGESPHDRGMSASLDLHKARPGFPGQASGIAWSLSLSVCLCFCVHVFVFVFLQINVARPYTDNWQTISSCLCFVFVCFEWTCVSVSSVIVCLGVYKYMSLYVLTDKLQTQLKNITVQ